MEEYITHSRDETVALGRRLAAELAPGSLIAFTGGLGAGKTAFCQGIAEGLGCTDPVSSPTFAIVNYYRGPRPFAHFDLYRIHTEVVSQLPPFRQTESHRSRGTRSSSQGVHRVCRSRQARRCLRRESYPRAAAKMCAARR